MVLHNICAMQRNNDVLYLFLVRGNALNDDTVIGEGFKVLWQYATKWSGSKENITLQKRLFIISNTVYDKKHMLLIFVAYITIFNAE